MSGLRERIYRDYLAPWIGSVVGRVRSERAGDADWSPGSIPLVTTLAPGTMIRGGRAELWMHAASAGELESLWPLIDHAVRDRVPTLVTAFSPSTLPSLARMKSDILETEQDLLVVAGSPVEGDWSRTLSAWKPRAFITARYEAWPELWMALGESSIPLVILGARPRRSIRRARAWVRALGAHEPRYRLAVDRAADADALRAEFGTTADIALTGDPRWDRVSARVREGHPRVISIARAAQDLPRPWWILGSAWPEDLDVLQSAIAEMNGTIWIAPHAMHAVERIMRRLPNAPGAARIPRTSTGESLAGAPKFLIIDEIGFLAEFYGLCDYAYVGGGFGQGMHSTLEPALHGLPVAAGPKGAGADTAADLAESGQLTIIRDASGARRWVAACADSDRGRERARRQQEIALRLGATARAWSFIRGA